MDDYGAMMEAALPGGWELDGLGDGAVLICPHGESLEPDGSHEITEDQEGEGEGEAGELCESPLLALGMI